MTADQFKEVFFALTGNEPMSWQCRLFQKRFVVQDFPPVVDLPTGLGKTMVMAIWLIARAVNEALPRRLIYVVDRRTVVDQATTLATKLQRRINALHRLARRRPELRPLCKSFPVPAISTLRGQLADNREWSRDPSRPAIIIGTVDLIGSALLFSGYRSSYKRRPLEAGLLGQDSLLVLDEAHLSRPFEKLLGSISDFQRAQGKPMQVVRMSATSTNATVDDVFRLDTNPASETFDLWSELDEKGKEKNQTKARFEAKKQLTIVTLNDKKKLTDRLASEAVKLAEDNSLPGKRIVVFVRKPDDARLIADTIRVHFAKKNSLGPCAESVEILTGTMRGLERDTLLEKPVPKRFLDGDESPDIEEKKRPVFLISTSAGEVGFDLNADHMVCDATTIDSLVQRLGRVNRRGWGDATVILVRESVKTKNDKVAELSRLDRAIANTLELIKDLNGIKPENIASPKNIASLKSGIWKDRYAGACSPEVPTVELTDVLLDAWSMTSIADRMPGRPQIGPWLRGVDDEQAQTTVVWRAELELFSDDPPPDKSLGAVFAKHPIRAHESLTVNTGYLIEFLKRIAKLKDRPSDLTSTRVAVHLPRGQVVCRTLQQLTGEPGILYADATLILPAKFGGLDSSGMLNVESIPKERRGDDVEPPSLDVADRSGYEQIDAVRSRLRIVIKRSEDGSWTPLPLPGGSLPDDIQLQESYRKSTELFDDLKEADLRVRLVQPIRFDFESVAVELLVCLAPAPAKKEREDQLLAVHVGAVEDEARGIADALALAEDDPVRVALFFAAKWHDEGKKARIWQVFAKNPDPDGVPLGKMAQSRDPKSLRGYRHEFGSLLRVHHPQRCSTTDCALPSDADVRELALHLIATHHGMSRPHFSTAIYHDFTDAERDAIHTDSIRRFARLQRKYGWWRLAWLENLLRCADALASANPDAEDDPADTDREAA